MNKESREKRNLRGIETSKDEDTMQKEKLKKALRNVKETKTKSIFSFNKFTLLKIEEVNQPCFLKILLQKKR